MSAIAGIVHFNEKPIPLKDGEKLMHHFKQFPADDRQMLQREQLFFGCHAQWITPESVGEKLPYYDETRKLAVVADAIIDNRDELFQKLVIHKSTSKTMTDSELIVRAYEKWGTESPKYLVGDFVFMIWDERNQKLFGARDFSGGRTLYFHHANQQFVFSTLMEPLFSLPDVEKTLNEQWLAQFLAISGMIDVADMELTPYKDIWQLPPAHSIVVCRGEVKLTRYMTLTAPNTLKYKSDDEYVEAFQDVFQEAVNARLRTHKNVGAQLSGGLDSGAVVGFASRGLQGRTLHTFSYVPTEDFPDYTPSYMFPNESTFIEETAAYIHGIEAQYCSFDNRDSFSEVNNFLDVMESPYKFFENSFWLKGMFEKAHEKNVGVLLNGGRGNISISWGPAEDYHERLFKQMRWITLLKELHHYSSRVGGSRFGRLPEIAIGSIPFLRKMFQEQSTYEIPRLINETFAAKTNVYDHLLAYGIDQKGWLSEKDPYKQRAKHFEELFHWNASNTISTKLSLRYGLWKRDPSNDLRVIRFCLAVPEDQYVKNGQDRALIRRATEHILPDKVRLNQRVYGVQGADWVYRMTPHWHTFMRELESIRKDDTMMQFLNRESIDEAIQYAKEGAIPERATSVHYRILMRTLIVSRFIKSLRGGEINGNNYEKSLGTTNS